MRSRNTLWSLIASCALVAGCTWGLRVETHTTDYDGHMGVWHERQVWAVGTVTNLPIGAQCQVDSQCASRYCKETHGGRVGGRIEYGYCVPDQPMHYHLDPCFHDVDTPGIQKQLFQHRVSDSPPPRGALLEWEYTYSREIGPLTSTRPAHCPAIRIPGSELTTPYPYDVADGDLAEMVRTTQVDWYALPEPVPPIETVTFMVVDIGPMLIFDGEPWGSPYMALRNDMVIPRSRIWEMSDLPKPGLCRGVRIEDDLWIDCPRVGTDARGQKIKYRGMGPPYRQDRGDVLRADHFYVPPPPPVDLADPSTMLREPTPLEVYFMKLGVPGDSYTEVRSRMDREPPVPGHHPVNLAWQYYYTTRQARFIDYKWERARTKYRGNVGDPCLSDRECVTGAVCKYTGVAFTLGVCQTPEWDPPAPDRVYEPMPPPE